MSDTQSNKVVLDLTIEVVSSFVGNNPVPADSLPDLLTSVHTRIKELGAPSTGGPRPDPAVPIKKSLTDDYIICLEDGKKFKTLKRHLRSKYNMTPQEYREKWGLPSDYPMVCNSYSKRRSAMAKDIGLGRKPGQRSRAK